MQAYFRRRGLDEEGNPKLLEDLSSDYDTDTKIEPDEDSECEDEAGYPKPSYLTCDPNTDLELFDLERPYTNKDDEEFFISSKENRSSISGQRWTTLKEKPEASQNVQFQPQSSNECTFSTRIPKRTGPTTSDIFKRSLI